MKILVIGGAGYIGTHVVIACQKKGYKVSVYDNLSTGCKENIQKGCKFFKGDILNSSALTKVMKKGFDAVIHLAAFKAAGESMLVPEKYSVNNIIGTINILNALCDAGISKIIFSSSAAVYGDPKYLPIDEKHPTEPQNYYGFTKLAIEGFLNWYDRLKGIKYSTLRYFNAAGYHLEEKIAGLERNPANLLPVIMEVACGRRERLEVFGDDYDTKDGTGIRDYIHVADLADAHIKALEYLNTKHESFVVNLGTGIGISVHEMLEAARKITGKPIPSIVTERRAGDPAVLCASSGMAKELLGWEAKNSELDVLIKSTWNIYKRIK